MDRPNSVLYEVSVSRDTPAILVASISKSAVSVVAIPNVAVPVGGLNNDRSVGRTAIRRPKPTVPVIGAAVSDASIKAWPKTDSAVSRQSATTESAVAESTTAESAIESAAITKPDIISESRTTDRDSEATTGLSLVNVSDSQHSGCQSSQHQKFLHCLYSGCIERECIARPQQTHIVHQRPKISTDTSEGHLR